jgi:alpha-L-fucosidase 2
MRTKTINFTNRGILFRLLVFCLGFYSHTAFSQTSDSKSKLDVEINPATLLWYSAPATKWDEALPVGNGRLGAMVFGEHGEERIQLNEETVWSGGPYSTVLWATR